MLVDHGRSHLLLLALSPSLMQDAHQTVYGNLSPPLPPTQRRSTLAALLPPPAPEAQVDRLLAACSSPTPTRNAALCRLKFNGIVTWLQRKGVPMAQVRISPMPP